MRTSLAKSCAALAMLVLAAHAPMAARLPPRVPPRPRPAAGRFSFAAVVALARLRAATAYSPPREEVPAWLAGLGADQYRGIEFEPNADIWRREATPFRLELLPVGFNFRTDVEVSLVEDGKVRDIAATPSMFRFAESVPRAPSNAALPLSGFRLRSRINSPRHWDEFLVFQGASYFRAIGRDEVYGLSARGLAIDTAAPSGEEFPAFTHFWIERPPRGASTVVVDALLQSRSATGAYRFIVKPGAQTVMNVDATLFARRLVHSYGVAPLTSMFLFGATDRGLMDDYRPQVHDSDGLQVTTNTGEHLWRPLANPAKLQVSAFTTEAPRGFGLVQRSRRFDDFEDLGAHYERRPSAWIEPQRGFGAGAVELVEIPSRRETNDNIVAFFRPTRPLQPGHAAHFAYRLTWLAQPMLPRGLGKVVDTLSGASLDGKQRVFQIDFAGAGEKVADLAAHLSASAGRTSPVQLSPNPFVHGFRASFALDPRGADLVELRLQISRANRPATETWLYRWTAR